MTTNATVAVSLELAERIADQLEAQAAREDEAGSKTQGEGNRLRWTALALRKQIRRAEIERYNAAHAEPPKAIATSAEKKKTTKQRGATKAQLAHRAKLFAPASPSIHDDLAALKVTR